MKIENYTEISDMAYELDEDYASIEGAELGELWSLLNAIWSRTDYAITDGFEMAIAKEIEAQYDNVKENATIVEETTSVQRKSKDLVWGKAKGIRLIRG